MNALECERILTVSDSRLQKIARTIIDESLKVRDGNHLLIRYQPATTPLAENLAALAQQRGADVQFQLDDPREIAAALGESTSEAAVKYLEPIMEIQAAQAYWASKVAVVLQHEPGVYSNLKPDIQVLRQNMARQVQAATMVHPWNYFNYPSEAEALIEGLPYEEYQEMILNACSQDWSEIRRVQKPLVSELSRAKQLEFFAGRNLDGSYNTHLIMELGIPFINSTIEKNIPGSEVYSAPKRETIEGSLHIPYRLRLFDRIIPNFSLRFEAGRVVDFNIDNGDQEDIDWIRQQLNQEGANEVGEVALGTNMAITRPLTNPLYSEKGSGSFHIALGYSYPETDNGVRAETHEDIVCFMTSRYGGGLVLVNGRPMQIDGKFVDPKLSALNPL